MSHRVHECDLDTSCPPSPLADQETAAHLPEAVEHEELSLSRPAIKAQKQVGGNPQVNMNRVCWQAPWQWKHADLEQIRMFLRGRIEAGEYRPLLSKGL